VKRRDFLTGGAGAALAASAVSAALESRLTGPPVPRHGRIKQGLWRVTFGAGTPFTLEDMCRIAVHLGVRGFDLIAPDDWPLLRRYGLEPLMVESEADSFENGIIHPEFHVSMERTLRPFLEKCRTSRVHTMVLIGGQKRGLSEEQALDHAVAFLERIRSQLEDSGVTAALENINNRYDEPGYSRPDQICGPFEWGIELCRRVGSPNVRMVCDIYHLQMQDGNITRTIRENIDRIAHFHVAGVPGRNELDYTQEVNFRYVAEVIASTSYTGYLSHEWRPGPGRDPLQSIAQALDIMDA
jgi:hydroxypyruvate isomerase